MANKNGREALRGVEASVLDFIVAEVLTSQQWAELLKASLERAAFLGDRQLAQRLVEAGAEMGDALHEAVGGGHGDILDDLLENGASVETKDEFGRTPLHIAARKGKPELVPLLLHKGADKDVRDAERWTPLYAAVYFDHVAAALALLAAGADYNVECADPTLGYFKRSAVHVAAEKGQVDILRAAIEQGVDVNTDDAYSYTPLHCAASRSNSEAIDILVEAGANIAAQDGGGSTPLHIAAAKLSLVAVNALLKHGADVNAQDNAGETPLHDVARVAGSQGAAEVVDCLLRSGADETLVGEDGTAAEVFGIGTEPKDCLAEEVNRVEELLANAPANRAWRRRGFLVLCRAHPDRMQLGLGQDSTHADIAPKNLAGTQLGGFTGAPGALVEGRAVGGNWAGTVARLLELKEEGLFRTIVEYL